jgi:C-terminal processing protease CtpA/Prc
MVGHGVAYLRIATFGDEEVVSAANTTLDALKLDQLAGMIIDLRYNMGILGDWDRYQAVTAYGKPR